MNKSDSASARFLPDVPAEQDAFGPHVAIAAAIEQIVLHDPDGYSIGLTGSYGSGKSTVVALLERSLSGQPDVCIWIFDAWAHEGDPLRRTFLESLIQRLIGENWVDAEKWKQELNKLTNRLRETTTKNLYRLSLFTIALALSVLLAPVGHVLLRAGLREISTFRFWSPDREFNAFVTLGSFLAVLPLLVVASAAAVGWYRRSKDPAHHPLAELGALLVQKSANEVQSTTTESAEPTSIEFEQYFRKLMSEALANSKRRLVLVIDNLDRVEPEDAQRVWSTLRTFLDRTSAKHRESWMSRLWVIIPYDPSGIRRMWDQEAAANESLSRSGLTTSFLDKTIDISFHVPPPLLSNWRDYLIDLLREALPAEIEGIELHRIYRVLAVARESSQTPTPRELKIFVNQLTLMYRLRGTDVPLSDLAYYVILQRDDHDIPAELLSGTLPHPHHHHLLSPEVTLNLAALVFGVDRQQGQQLLLAGPITEALREGDRGEILRLQSLTPGFGAVLEHALSEAAVEWAAPGSLESAYLLAAARAIDDESFLEAVPSPTHIHLRDILRSAVMRITFWYPLNLDSGKGLLALNRLVNDEQVASHSIGILSLSLLRSDSKSGLEWNAVGMLAVELATGLESLGLSAALEDGIQVPGGATAYLEAVTAVIGAVREENDPNHKYFQILRTSADPHQLVEAFAERTSAGTFGQADLIALRTLSSGARIFDWTPLITAIVSRIESGGVNVPSEVNMLFATLQFLVERCGSGEAKEALSNLFLGLGSSRAWEACTGNRVDVTQATARLLYAQMIVDPSFENQLTSTAQALLSKELSEPSGAVAQCLATLSENAGTKDLLLTVGEQSKDARPMVAAVLRQLHDRGNSSSFFSAEMIARHWRLLPLGVLDALLSGDNSRSSAVARLIEKGPVSVSGIRLYSKLLSVLRRKKQFANWLVEHLHTISQADWLTDLRGPEEWLGLAVELHQHGFSPELSHPLRSALIEYADEVQSGSAQPLNLSGASLKGLLDPSDHALVEDQLLEDVFADATGRAEAFFSVFGAILHDHRRITTDDSVISRILVPLIEARHPSGVKWINGLFNTRGNQWLDGLDKARVRAFKRAVSLEMRDGSADEVMESARLLARQLGIRKAAKRRRLRLG